MYRSFYSLEKKPFHITPDPEFLFLSPSHKEAFAAIIYGIEQRKGFLAITGEVGVGKTTILRAYLEKTGHEQHRIIYVFNAAVSFSGLLRLILGEFGVPVSRDDTFEMVNRLHHLLVEEYQNSRNVVLIIDEAQNMPVATLENLRMLSNLETSEDKLLQILLVGQPELERLLNLHDLRQLRQRIAIHCRINPLTAAESLAYIQHRLAKASSMGQVIFSEGSLKPIIKAAGGIPRIINILCDQALVTGFGYQKRPITRKIVTEVVSEYCRPKSRRRRTWWLVPFAVAALFALLFFAGFPVPLPHPAAPGKGEAPLPKASSVERQHPAAVAPPGKDAGAANQAVVSPPLGNGEGGAAPSMEKQEPLQGKGPDRPEEPLSAVSLANTTPPAAAAADELRDGPSPGTPTAWVDHHLPSLTPDASPLTSPSEPVTKIVKEGDCITHLVAAVYGYVDRKLIDAVKENNPHIKDINMIKTGDLITFPRTDRMKGQLN